MELVTTTRKISLGRPCPRWKDKIRMDLKEINIKRRIKLIRHGIGIMGKALVNLALNLWVS
jgi:hypothetical protein